jgi:hypothetical protein
MWVRGLTTVWVAQPGEVPPPEIGIPGFPDQGLPGLPPGFWGPGGTPGQPLPPSWGRPPVAGQPLPRPPWTWPTDPGWGVEEGSPGQGLPTPPREPKAHDLDEHPEEPGEGGRWLVAAYGSDIRWVYLPADPEEPERAPK